MKLIIFTLLLALLSGCQLKQFFRGKYLVGSLTPASKQLSDSSNLSTWVDCNTENVNEGMSIDIRILNNGKTPHKIKGTYKAIADNGRILATSNFEYYSLLAKSDFELSKKYKRQQEYSPNKEIILNHGDILDLNTRIKWKSEFWTSKLEGAHAINVIFGPIDDKTWSAQCDFTFNR